MKILSYVLEGEMIRVTTDNKDRPDFVYFADRFDSKARLEAEILKSIEKENINKDKKEKKIKKLKKELDNKHA